MVSLMPATDSRSIVTRGFGQRDPASTPACATSMALRIARTRGLSLERRAKGDEPPVGDETDAIRERPGKREVVQHDHDRAALVCEIA